MLRCTSRRRTSWRRKRNCECSISKKPIRPWSRLSMASSRSATSISAVWCRRRDQRHLHVRDHAEGRDPRLGLRAAGRGVRRSAGVDAVVRVPELPDREFPGTVTRIADAQQSGTRTLLTEIDLPNPDGALRSGVYCMVELKFRAGRRLSSCLPRLSSSTATACRWRSSTMARPRSARSE